MKDSKKYNKIAKKMQQLEDRVRVTKYKLEPEIKSCFSGSASKKVSHRFEVIHNHFNIISINANRVKNKAQLLEKKCRINETEELNRQKKINLERRLSGSGLKAL